MALGCGRNGLLVLAMILGGQIADCLGEEDDERPCGFAFCEGDTKDLGFTIAHKACAFRVKLDVKLDENCGIKSGSICGEEERPPPTMEPDDDTTMGTNDTMGKNTTEMPPRPPMAFIGPTSAERNGGTLCKKAAVPVIVWDFKLQRRNNEGGEFLKGDKKIPADGTLNATDCEVEDVKVKNSSSKDDPNREIKASQFAFNVNFPGIIKGKVASLTVRVQLIHESGSYNYEGVNVSLKEGEIKMTFEASNFIHWFCDDSSTCAASVKLGFKVNVGKPNEPATDSGSSETCEDALCRGTANLTGDVRVAMLYRANDKGMPEKIETDDAEVGLSNSIIIAKHANSGETYSFDYRLVPSKTQDPMYIVKEKPKPTIDPGSKTRDNMAVCITTSSLLSLVPLLALSFLLIVET